MAALLLRPRRRNVSVVVEVTGSNASFLDECVANLLEQERRPGEVLLSVAGTGADIGAAVDSVLGSELPFPVRGVPRDVDSGVAQAGGDYLMVLEAGDVLGTRAISSLAGSLDESGSSVAVTGSPACRGCTVATAPQAAVSVDLASMMMRTGHWSRNELGRARDPMARWLQPVHAVLAASTVDVVDETARRGPRRGTGVPFGALPGFAPHLSRLLPSVRGLLDRLDGEAPASARQHLVRWLVAGELSSYLEDAERCDQETWTALSDFARELLAELPPEAFSEVPVEPRVRARLAADGRREDLERFNTERWHEDGVYPTEVRDGAVLAVLPVQAPVEVLTLSARETPLVTQVRRARWGAVGDLELEVLAFTRRVGSDAGPAAVDLTLESGSGRRMPLPVAALRSLDVNMVAGERHHDHSDGLFTASVDLAELAAMGAESVSLHVRWERAGVHRAGTVAGVEGRGSAGALPPRTHDGVTVAFDPVSARIVCGQPALSPEPVPSATPGSVVRDLRLDGDVLVVAGSLVGVAGGGPVRLRVRGPKGGCQVKLPAEDGPFEARLPLRHDPWGLGETPLPPGSFRLRLQVGGSGPGRIVLDDALVARTPYVDRSSAFRLRVERNPDGSAQLVLGAPLADDEVGLHAQHELRRWYAGDDHRLDPHLVYLQAYGGFTATDSPLAIHHELRRSRPELRLVWGAVDSSVVVPEDAERVLLRSRDFYRTMATCGHIVTNIDMGEWFHKRPGQRLLQTTHGYPGKAMGSMVWETRNYPPSVVERQLRRTSGTWDLLLMPHPRVDGHYREQYRYEGPILSAGYPRDDALLAVDAGQRREDARRRLGIGDRIAVLYAPTWRDDLSTNFRAALMPSTFDVEHAAEALGDDHVILLRGHRFHRRRRQTRRQLLDVTDYPEINDLILAADVGVLDYSSLRFDLALTGRPMIFLVPDLDRYETGRGFMYDFRSSAPGPLLDTTAEVVDALRDLDGVVRRHAAEYARFNETFNSTQDGRAAERAVEAFFGSGSD